MEKLTIDGNFNFNIEGVNNYSFATIEGELIKKKIMNEFEKEKTINLKHGNAVVVKVTQRNEIREYKINNELIELSFIFHNNEIAHIMPSNQDVQMKLEKYLISKQN